MHDRKLEIVLGLIPQIPMEYQQSIESAMKTWWVNIRRDGGMRLTDAGYEIMHDVLKIESWVVDLANVDRSCITKKTILELDRKLKWPYYLDFNVRKKRQRIIFFGGREAMMASLYNDINLFLHHISA